MSKVFGRILGYLSNRNSVGMDKAGNRYFARHELIDGVLKEKRWVKFKGEEDPTSIPVEWICWLNGQRKNPPTPEEMAELEARRELVRQNVERIKKEEQRRAIQGSVRKMAGKGVGPDLQSFLRQVPKPEGEAEGASEAADDLSKREETEKAETPVADEEPSEPRTTEPSGSGASFRPGTWQPPS